MSFDPLAATATLAIVLFALTARAVYRQVQTRLFDVWKAGYQAGYDARVAIERHGLRPIEEATWRTDN